jgi:hypothetical protein
MLYITLYPSRGIELLIFHLLHLRQWYGTIVRVSQCVKQKADQL